ncbi:MAG TPA: transferrin receptor-like dimerization domain-containing protein [Terriglobales bacterium]|nr:transferrin receptor-like dimerization domain-containing protein [Terriglobales bacterium]
MKLIWGAFLLCATLISNFHGAGTAAPLAHAEKSGRGGSENSNQPTSFSSPNAGEESAVESRFLAVPDPKLAQEHLKILTRAPHIAGSPEDKATAEYVARKFREAGLETEIVEYRVWMNYPSEISVDVTAPPDVKMHGPTRERVDGDPYQDDPRVVVPYSGMSPSGDVEADVVYANYGSPEDFEKLHDLKVDVRGKIVLVRYGQNFRGVKVYVAQEHGAAGVIIYSDPADDGWKKGDKYPKGPWRPDTGVQRGSIGYMFEFPGDPTTPGIASVPALPESKRIPPEKSAQMPKVPTTPLSYHDAWPILESLGGPESPRDWQGALPFTYHVGPGPVRVKMHLKQDYQFRTIWDVIGRVRGGQMPEEWVVAGNHRDAWVYGAVDPNSGTTAMLETVHGIGELLKSGWKPKRTIVFGSWDAEELGLIGSTEWGEEHAAELANAAAYFNVDVAVSGPKFGASAVPSLKQFLRDVSKAVPSPKGGTVYDAWRKSGESKTEAVVTPQEAIGDIRRVPAVQAGPDVPVGDLGSGSDYTVFLQRLGVPSTDVGSSGSYGVYHSVFDNFNWFTKFADPDFIYEQEMARVYGIEMLRMADADVLPYDYEEYGKEIAAYIDAAKKKAEKKFAGKSPDFGPVTDAAKHLASAGTAILEKQKNASSDISRLNRVLREAERAMLIPEGLPNRPWFRHAIYAPGVYTGYAAVVIPGVNEAIDAGDLERTRQQIAVLAAAVNRAAKVLESYR